jgi:CheY-like chemotaxis protein
MTKKIPKDQPVHVLNIGTRILVKDVMDQYLRTLGEVKTYYAAKLSSALESFHEKRQAVIFCEHTFPEGGAIEFVEAIGGLDAASDRYFILAAESVSDDLVSLAMEKGMDEILVKPFSTENIYQIMERYLEKRKMGDIDWVKELRVAKKAFLEKRFQEADELYGQTAKRHWHNAGVLLDCADYFVKRQQPQLALPLLEKVLTESPDHVRSLHLHGCALKRMGRYKEAAKEFNRANLISSLNSGRNQELADTYVAMAEEEIQNALKAESESSSLILKRAQYQLLRRDFGALVTYLDSKRAYLSESAKKEAEAFTALAKKLGGLK